MVPQPLWVVTPVSTSIPAVVVVPQPGVVTPVSPSILLAVVVPQPFFLEGGRYPSFSIHSSSSTIFLGGRYPIFLIHRCSHRGSPTFLWVVTPVSLSIPLAVVVTQPFLLEGVVTPVSPFIPVAVVVPQPLWVVTPVPPSIPTFVVISQFLRVVTPLNAIDGVITNPRRLIFFQRFYKREAVLIFQIRATVTPLSWSNYPLGVIYPQSGKRFHTREGIFTIWSNQIGISMDSNHTARALLLSFSLVFT